MSRSENIEKLIKLKSKSGTHSPSPKEIEGELGYNPILADYCFLSNPYATELVIAHYKNKLSEEKLFNLFESYPASSSYVAKNIAKFEGVDPENIVVGNGAIQAIEWICDGWNLKNLLIPTPTFSTYYEYMQSRHTLCDEIWLNENVDADKFIDTAQKNGCDSILLINPNNPTGETLKVSEIEKLISKLGDLKLIIDESFCHFLDDYYEFKDFRNRLNNDNVVFVKSMSKDFGIAGIRLGYLYGFDKSLLAYAESKTTWNLNNFAVMFSEILGDFIFQQQYRKVREKYLEERRQFFVELNQIKGIKVFDTQSNFFLIKVDTENERLVYELLVDTGVYVRTMEDKIGLNSSFIRVASRKHEENMLFLEAIKKYV